MNIHFHPAAPRIGRLAGCLAIALGVGAASAASPFAQHAASKHQGPVTHQVLSCDDMSLRQTITSAADGDTVTMPVGCSLVTLDSGEIPILVDNLTLTGPGSASHRGWPGDRPVDAAQDVRGHGNTAPAFRRNCRLEDAAVDSDLRVDY